jgi:arylsulfatase A-like enzyme
MNSEFGLFTFIPSIFRVLKMLKRYLPLLISFYCLFLSLQAQQKPNIVYIMIDDLAWADVGYNGHEFYETPHIDRIAKAGMIFNRAYSGGPNCLPTRACLISGMYTPRTQIYTPGTLSKGNIDFMHLKVPAKGADKSWNTFASLGQLKPEVISIAEVLKTAGYMTARFGKWHVGPDTQGFDISDPSGKGAKIGQKYYGNTDVAEWLTDASVKFIEKHSDHPFFLYLSHWDVHTPIKARKEITQKYDQKLSQGTWSRKWNTTYAAMIEAADKSVGRVYNKLKTEGLLDNTLIVFTSDNGGHAGATTNAPLKGAKGAFFEGGVRVPTFMHWPKVIQAGTHCKTPITSVDYMPTFADMAQANLPTQQPIDGTSLLPLLKGHSIDDRAIFWHYPLYLAGSGEGQVIPVHNTQNMYWRAVPSSMICKGEYKLIQFFEDQSVQLYHIGNDPSEVHELSQSHPEKTKELLQELKKWQKSTNAVTPHIYNEKFNSPKLKKKTKNKKS